MTIKNLVELMNQNKNKLLKPEQAHAFLKKELNVKEYLSIKEKKELVDDIVNACILYADGVYKFDEIDKYIYFTMKTIATYTSLELSDDMESDYDMLCSSQLLNQVVETFNGEYENVKVLLQMKCDYILSGNTIEAQVGRFFDSLLERVDDVTGILSDKVQNFNISDLPLNKETLGMLMEFIKSQK